MGKKYKKSKKVLWRRLSLNEASTKASENGLIEVEECVFEEEEEGNTCFTPPPQSQSRPQESIPLRKPFQPNFYPGDQRRFQHPSEYGPRRGVSVERFAHPRFFRGGRPFFHDARQGPPYTGSPFQGGRRRPFKFYGRGGFFVRGQSPYGRDGGLRRRWSQDEGLCFLHRDDDDEGEGGDRLSQPVHTVLINDEQYTKIQTPRQEVIFKKSCWDRKCDSVEIEYDPSLTGSSTTLEHGSRESQGDQGSLTGSIEESSNIPSGVPCRDDPQQHEINHRLHSHYEDSASVFLGDPNAPPLAGVVMQQTFPGGPMISIPVQWTPFLDPGLVPGDTALTTLDPAFTHVIDPKNLTVDPVHILPVQHDANGCPVTVQVKIDADGIPIEIEPNAFTVSLNTLEQRQQDVLFHRSNDYSNCTNLQMASSSFQICHQQESGAEVEKDEILLECSGKKSDSEVQQNELRADLNEDCTHDSQYASMSEPSTAPTTPSGELCDHCDSNSVDSNFESDLNSKSPNNESTLQSPKESRRVSCIDSLRDSVNLENDVDETCSYCDPFDDSSNAPKHFVPSRNNFSINKLSASLNDDSDSSRHNDVRLGNLNDSAHFTLDSLSQCSTCESQTSLSHDASQRSCCQNNLDSVDSCCHTLTSDSDVQTMESGISSSPTSSSISKGLDIKRKEKKLKKLRSSSIESDYDCQTSSKNAKLIEKNETTSKYQAKREAKKIKKEKKKSSKDKSKIKLASTKNPSKCSSKPDDDKEISSIDELDLNQSKSSAFEDSSEESCLATFNIQSNFSHRKTTSSESANLDSNKTLESALISSQFLPSESKNDFSEGSLTKEVDSEEKLLCDSGDSSYSIAQNDSVSRNVLPEAVKGDQDAQSQDGGLADSSESQHADIEDNFGTQNTEKESTNDAGFTCKPGFIMVPILTPYYDPAVLYGYPLVLADNSVDRSYTKKKKKKFRKKYQDHHMSLPLDTELYVGETFVATPNGYMVPIDSSHMCQIHGYQYNHNMYPQVVHDDGFVSLEHSPYLPEAVPELAYQKGYYYQDHAYQPSFSRLREVERKQIEEVLEQHPKEESTKISPVDSADSGVSESEEPSVGVEKVVTLNENNVVNIEEAAINENISDDHQTKIVMKPVVRKENSKKKAKVVKPKFKKPIIEIEEPDFSSFSGSILRFEVKRENSGSCTKSEVQRNTKQELYTKDVKPKNKKSRNKKPKEKAVIIAVGKITTKLPCNSSSSVPNNVIPVVIEENHNDLSTSANPINDKTWCVNSPPPQPEQSEVSPKTSDKENEGKKKKKKKKSGKNKGNNEASRENHETRQDNDDNKLSENSDSISFPRFEATTELCSQNLSLQNCSNPTPDYDTDDSAPFNTNITHDSTDMSPPCIDDEVSKCSISSSKSVNNIKECSFSENTYDNLKESQISAESTVSVEETDILAYSLAPSNLVSVVDCSMENDICTEEPSNDSVIKTDFNDDCDLFEKHETSFPPILLGSLEPVLEEVLPLLNEEKLYDDKCCGNVMKNSMASLETNSLKDLGVTEAVMKWMTEVSPEKVFSLSEERRSALLTELFFSNEDLDSDENYDEDHLKVTDSKNGESNPLVVKSSKKTLGRRSERVASFSLNQRTSPPNRIRSPSRDTIDDYDGESVISNLSRERLYSSSSSSSNTAVIPIEETSALDDSRVYDPSMYSKYYQLGVDMKITPTNSTANSSRESTLAPSLKEEADCEEVFHHISLSTEKINAEKDRSTLNHVLPSLCDEVSLPHCVCSTSALLDGSGKIRDSLSSASSSGIGSSLASTPIVSPAHEPIYPLITQGELQRHPFQCLKGEELPLSYRAVCSIM